MQLILSLLTISIFSVVNLANGQTSKMMVAPIEINHASHYKVDYELKNYTFINGDSTLLNAINFDEIEAYRTELTDVEINYPSINEVIIIYSDRKILAIKNAYFNSSDYLNQK